MSWLTLFQQTDQAVFVLDRRRRIRHVNAAFERLTGTDAELVRGLSCTRRRVAPTRAEEKSLAMTLRPPREVISGTAARVRRAVPPERAGPPWWDIDFWPLTEAGELLGVLGKITLVGEKRPKSSPERLSESLMTLRRSMAGRFTLELLDADASNMRRVRTQVRTAASLDVPVWISGPSGVGKCTLARIIHHLGNPTERTFAAVDCAALPAGIVRGMLFGPSGLALSPRCGTIYIREPGRLPSELRNTILDWHDEREGPRPRILVGSHESADQFDPDWAAVFAPIEIRLPPLAERREEIPKLVYRLVERFGLAEGLDPELLPVLVNYNWPGNIRQLGEVIRSAVRVAEGKRVERTHLPRHILEAVTTVPPSTEAAPKLFLNLDLILEQVERRLIQVALRRCKGNHTEASELLGIWRTRLGRRMTALKIELD